jgi:hypothetical protein
MVIELNIEIDEKVYWDAMPYVAAMEDGDWGAYIQSLIEDDTEKKRRS